MTEIEDEEDDEYDSLIGKDDWEDVHAYQQLLDQMPNGWYMIKIENYDTEKLLAIDEWCQLSCRKKYGRVQWRAYCAYTIGIQFECGKDAVYFKLMWS